MKDTNDWKTQTYRLSWLKMKAAQHVYLDNAMTFLRAIGVVPADVRFTRRNALPNTSLPAHAIPAQYLAEVANDWDDLGPATPSEFINAISFECAGTPQRDIVAQTLAALGAVMQEQTLAA